MPSDSLSVNDPRVSHQEEEGDQHQHQHPHRHDSPDSHTPMRGSHHHPHNNGSNGSGSGDDGYSGGGGSGVQSSVTPMTTVSAAPDPEIKNFIDEEEEEMQSRLGPAAAKLSREAAESSEATRRVLVRLAEAKDRKALTTRATAARGDIAGRQEEMDVKAMAEEEARVKATVEEEARVKAMAEEAAKAKARAEEEAKATARAEAHLAQQLSASHGTSTASSDLMRSCISAGTSTTNTSRQSREPTPTPTPPAGLAAAAAAATRGEAPQQQQQHEDTAVVAADAKDGHHDDHDGNAAEGRQDSPTAVPLETAMGSAGKTHHTSRGEAEAEAVGRQRSPAAAAAAALHCSGGGGGGVGNDGTVADAVGGGIVTVLDARGGSTSGSHQPTTSNDSDDNPSNDTAKPGEIAAAADGARTYVPSIVAAPIAVGGGLGSDGISHVPHRTTGEIERREGARKPVAVAAAVSSSFSFWPLPLAPPLSYDEARNANSYYYYMDHHYQQAPYSGEASFIVMEETRGNESDGGGGGGDYGALGRRGDGSNYNINTHNSSCDPFQDGGGDDDDQCSSVSATAFLNSSTTGSSSNTVIINFRNSNDELFDPNRTAPWQATGACRQLLLLSLATLIMAALLAPVVAYGSLISLASVSGGGGGGDAFPSSSSSYSRYNYYVDGTTMSAVGFGAAATTLLLLAVACTKAARLYLMHKNKQQQQPPSSSSSSPSSASTLPPLGASVLFLLLSPRMLLLTGVAVAVAGANLVMHTAFAPEQQPPVVVVGVSLAAQLLSGAGWALAAAGLLMMACAEAGGVAAGAVAAVALAFFPAWLLASAGDFFILPLLLDAGTVSPAGAMLAVTAVASSSIVYAAALAMVVRGDGLAHATAAAAHYFAPGALRRARRSVASGRFALRALSCACLSAAVLLLATRAVPILSQRISSSSGSSSSYGIEDVGGGADNFDNRRGINGAHGGGPAPLSLFLSTADPRRCAGLMFAAALLMWPFAIAPASSAVALTRWLRVLFPPSLLAVVLAALWVGFALLVDGDAPRHPLPRRDVEAAPVKGGGGRRNNSSSSSDGNSTSIGGGGGVASNGLAMMSHVLVNYVLTPVVCATLNGVVFAAIAASVLRSIANSGATVPGQHHRRQQQQHPSSSSNKQQLQLPPLALQLAGSGSGSNRRHHHHHHNRSRDDGHPMSRATAAAYVDDASLATTRPTSSDETSWLLHGTGAAAAGGGGGASRDELESEWDDSTENTIAATAATTTVTLAAAGCLAFNTAAAAGGGGSISNDDDDDGGGSGGKGPTAHHHRLDRRVGASAVLLLVVSLVITCTAVCAVSQAFVSALLFHLYRKRNSSSSSGGGQAPPVMDTYNDGGGDGVPADVRAVLVWIVAGLCCAAAVLEVLGVVAPAVVAARRAEAVTARRRAK